MFIATKEINILKVMPKVISSINKWQRSILHEYLKNNGFESKLGFMFRDMEKYGGLLDFSNGIGKVTTDDFRSFCINFIVKGEKRNLSVFIDCSCDYSETYKGEKIIFSIGCWGMSKEIMMSFAKNISEFGDIYFCENDAADDFEKLEF